MSTKIWTAWKIPSNKLNDFLESTRADMWESYIKHIKILLSTIQEDEYLPILEKRKDSLYYKGENEEAVRAMWDCLEKKMKEASISYQDSMYAVDSGWRVFYDGKFTYLAPFGRDYKYTVPDYAIDYHYQNQCDKSKEVSSHQWGARCRTWDRIWLKNKHPNMLLYYIVDFVPPYAHSAWDTEIALDFWPNI